MAIKERSKINGMTDQAEGSILNYELRMTNDDFRRRKTTKKK